MILTTPGTTAWAYTSSENPKQQTPLTTVTKSNTAQNLQAAQMFFELALRLKNALQPQSNGAGTPLQQQEAWMREGANGLNHNIQTQPPVLAPGQRIVEFDSGQQMILSPGQFVESDKNGQPVAVNWNDHVEKLQQQAATNTMSEYQNAETNRDNWDSYLFSKKIEIEDNKLITEIQHDNLTLLADSFKKQSPADSVKQLTNEAGLLTLQVKQQIYQANTLLVNFEAQEQSVRAKLNGDPSNSLAPVIGVNKKVSDLTAEFNAATKAIKSDQDEINQIYKQIKANPSTAQGYQSKLKSLEDDLTNKKNQITRDNSQLCGAGTYQPANGIALSACNGYPATMSANDPSHGGLIAYKKKLDDQLAEIVQNEQSIQSNYFKLWQSSAYQKEFANDLGMAYDPNEKKKTEQNKSKKSTDPTPVSTFSALQAQIALLKKQYADASNPKKPSSTPLSISATPKQSNGGLFSSIIDRIQTASMDLMNSFGPSNDKSAQAVNQTQQANAASIQQRNTEYQKQFNQRADAAAQSEKKISALQMAPYKNFRDSTSAWQRTKDILAIRMQANSVVQQLRDRISQADKLVSQSLQNGTDLKTQVANYMCKDMSQCNVAANIKDVSTPGLAGSINFANLKAYNDKYMIDCGFNDITKCDIGTLYAGIYNNPLGNPHYIAPENYGVAAAAYKSVYAYGGVDAMQAQLPTGEKGPMAAAGYDWLPYQMNTMNTSLNNVISLEKSQANAFNAAIKDRDLTSSAANMPQPIWPTWDKTPILQSELGSAMSFAGNALESVTSAIQATPYIGKGVNYAFGLFEAPKDMAMGLLLGQGQLAAGKFMSWLGANNFNAFGPQLGFITSDQFSQWGKDWQHDGTIMGISKEIALTTENPATSPIYQKLWGDPKDNLAVVKNDWGLSGATYDNHNQLWLGKDGTRLSDTLQQVLTGQQNVLSYSNMLGKTSYDLGDIKTIITSLRPSELSAQLIDSLRNTDGSVSVATLAAAAIPMLETTLSTGLGMYGFGVAVNSLKAFAAGSETGVTLNTILSSFTSSAAESAVDSLQAVKYGINTVADKLIWFNEYPLGFSLQYGFAKQVLGDVNTLIDNPLSSTTSLLAAGHLIGTGLGMGGAAEAGRAYGWMPANADGTPALRDPSTISTIASSMGKEAISLTINTGLTALGGNFGINGGIVGSLTSFMGAHKLQQTYQDQIKDSIALQVVAGVENKGLTVEAPNAFQWLAGARSPTVEIAGIADNFRKAVTENPSSAFNILAPVARAGRVEDMEILGQMAAGGQVDFGNGVKSDITDTVRQAANSALLEAKAFNLSAEDLAKLQEGGKVKISDAVTLFGDQLPTAQISDMLAAHIINTSGLEVARQIIGNQAQNELNLKGATISVDGELRNALARGYVSENAAHPEKIAQLLANPDARVQQVTAEAILASTTPMDSALIARARATEVRVLIANKTIDINPDGKPSAALVGRTFTRDGTHYRVGELDTTVGAYSVEKNIAPEAQPEHWVSSSNMEPALVYAQALGDQSGLAKINPTDVAQGTRFTTVDGIAHRVVGTEGDLYQVQRLEKVSTRTTPEVWSAPKKIDAQLVNKTVELNALQQRAAELTNSGLSRLANNLKVIAAERIVDIRQIELNKLSSTGDTSLSGQIQVASAQVIRDIDARALVEARALVDPSVTRVDIVNAKAVANQSQIDLQKLSTDAESPNERFKVTLPAALEKFVGDPEGATIEGKVTSANDAALKLEAKYPGLSGKLIDPNTGELRPYVDIKVGAESIEVAPKVSGGSMGGDSSAQASPKTDENQAHTITKKVSDDALVRVIDLHDKAVESIKNTKGGTAIEADGKTPADKFKVTHSDLDQAGRMVMSEGRNWTSHEDLVNAVARQAIQVAKARVLGVEVVAVGANGELMPTAIIKSPLAGVERLPTLKRMEIFAKIDKAIDNAVSQSPEILKTRVGLSQDDLAQLFEAKRNKTETPEQQKKLVKFDSDFQNLVNPQIEGAVAKILNESNHREVVHQILDKLASSENPLEKAFADAYPNLKNPYEFRFNGAQSDFNVDSQLAGNSLEVATSAGKSILEGRTAFTHLLSHPDAVDLISVPTAGLVRQLVHDPILNRLASQLGIKINDLNLSIEASHIDAYSKLNARRTLNITTPSDFSQLFNDQLNGETPQIREVAKKFWKNEKNSARHTTFDEGQLYLTDNVEAIRGDGGHVTGKAAQDKYSELFNKIHQGIVTDQTIQEWNPREGEVKDPGTLYFTRDSKGSIIPTEGLVAYYQDSIPGQHFEYNEIRGMIDAAVHDSRVPGGRPYDGLVIDSESNALVVSGVNGKEPTRISQDLPSLIGRALLLEKMQRDGVSGYENVKVDWELTRGGGKTVAAASPFQMMTELGGTKSLLSGTLAQAAQGVEVLTGGQLLRVGTIHDYNLEGDVSSPDRKLNNNFAAGTQDISTYAIIRNTRSQMMESSGQIVGDQFIKQLKAVEGLEGHGTFVGMLDMQSQQGPFREVLKEYLTSKIIGDVDLQQKLGINQDSSGSLLQGNVLVRAVDSKLNNLFSTLDANTIQDTNQIDIAKTRIRNGTDNKNDGRIVLAGKEAYTGLSLNGDRLQTLALNAHENPGVLNRQLIARVGRQLQSGEGYHEDAEGYQLSNVDDLTRTLDYSISHFGDDIERQATPEIKILLKEYHDNGLNYESDQGQRERALYLAQKIGDLIERGQSYESLAGRLIDITGVRTPIERFLAELGSGPHGTEDPVYKTAYKLYQDQVLDHSSKLYEAYPTMQVQEGSEILRSNFNNMVGRVKMLEQMISDSAQLNGHLELFRNTMKISELEMARDNYKTTAADRTMSLPKLAKDASPLKLVSMIKNFEPYILSGIATTNVAPQTYSLMAKLQRSLVTSTDRPTTEIPQDSNSSTENGAPTRRLSSNETSHGREPTSSEIALAQRIRMAAQNDLVRYQQAGVSIVPTMVALMASAPNPMTVISLAQQLMPTAARVGQINIAGFVPENSAAVPVLSMTNPGIIGQMGSALRQLASGGLASEFGASYNRMREDGHMGKWDSFKQTSGKLFTQFVPPTSVPPAIRAVATAKALLAVATANGASINEKPANYRMEALGQALQHNLNTLAFDGGQQVAEHLMPLLTSNAAKNPKAIEVIQQAVAIALNAPPIDTTVNNGYKIGLTDVKVDGQKVPLGVLKVTDRQVTSEAILSAVSLVEFARASGVEANIILPAGSGPRYQAIRDIVDQANGNGKPFVFVAEAGQSTVNGHATPSLRLGFLDAAKDFWTNLRGRPMGEAILKLDNFEKANQKLEELQVNLRNSALPTGKQPGQDPMKQIQEGMAAIQAQQAHVDHETSLLREVAPQFVRAIGLKDAFGNPVLQIPADVETFLTALANAPDNAQAQAAIVGYQRAVEDPLLAEAVATNLGIYQISPHSKVIQLGDLKSDARDATVIMEEKVNQALAADSALTADQILIVPPSGVTASTMQLLQQKAQALKVVMPNAEAYAKYTEAMAYNRKEAHERAMIHNLHWPLHPQTQKGWLGRLRDAVANHRKALATGLLVGAVAMVFLTNGLIIPVLAGTAAVIIIGGSGLGLAFWTPAVPSVDLEPATPEEAVEDGIAPQVAEPAVPSASIVHTPSWTSGTALSVHHMVSGTSHPATLAHSSTLLAGSPLVHFSGTHTGRMAAAHFTTGATTPVPGAKSDLSALLPAAPLIQKPSEFSFGTPLLVISGIAVSLIAVVLDWPHLSGILGFVQALVTHGLTSTPSSGHETLMMSSSIPTFVVSIGLTLWARYTALVTPVKSIAAVLEAA